MEHDLSTTEEVNFASAQLTEVPIKLYENIWINIRSLNLDHNFLARIPSVLFHSIPQVKKLRLAHNYLEAIPPTIAECLQLETLQLEHNCLVVLPHELKALTKLQRLTLHYNILEVNDVLLDITLSLPTLKTITLNSNPIPKSVVKIIEWKCEHNTDFKKSPSSLRKKFLEMNGLEISELTLPKYLSQLIRLEELEMKNNHFRTLPLSFNLRQLQKLTLDNNFFSNIPHVIFDLPELTFLSMGKNKIDHISSDITKLKKLRKLKLNHNQLRSIPDHICSLTKLKTLHLDHNLIVSPNVSSRLEELKNLVELFLDNNMLKDLPPQIYALPKLKKFTLESNPLNSSYSKDSFTVNIPTHTSKPVEISPKPNVTRRRKSVQIETDFTPPPLNRGGSENSLVGRSSSGRSTPTGTASPWESIYTGSPRERASSKTLMMKEDLWRTVMEDSSGELARVRTISDAKNKRFGSIASIRTDWSTPISPPAVAEASPILQLPSMEPTPAPKESPRRESYAIPQFDVADLDFEDMIKKRLAGRQLVKGSTIAALPSQQLSDLDDEETPRNWSDLRLSKRNSITTLHTSPPPLIQEPLKGGSLKKKIGRTLSFHPSTKEDDSKSLRSSQSEPVVSKTDQDRKGSRKSIWGLLRSASFNFRDDTEKAKKPPLKTVQNPVYGKELPQRSPAVKKPPSGFKPSKKEPEPPKPIAVKTSLRTASDDTSELDSYSSDSEKSDKKDMENNNVVSPEALTEMKKAWRESVAIRSKKRKGLARIFADSSINDQFIDTKLEQESLEVLKDKSKQLEDYQRTDKHALRSSLFHGGRVGVDEELVFGTNSQEHVYLKGGTLQKLVQLLCEDKASGALYETDFLFTFRKFCTTHQLLELLVSNYQQNPACTKRVCGILKKWIDIHPYDFKEDNDLNDELKSFLHNNVGEDTSSVLDALAKSRKRKTFFTSDSGARVVPPTPHLPVNLKFSVLHLLDLHPEEVARQMTLIEQNLLRKVELREWLEKEESKKPNIMAVIERFNFVSRWVSTEIVTADTIDHRLVLINRFLIIATKCIELNNFNSVMEIMSGLEAASVQRLKQTWMYLPQNSWKIYLELSELLSMQGNFKHFRDLLDKAKGPCLPYIGIFLADLVFINENPDALNGTLINFQKHEMTAKILRKVQTYQQNSYNLIAVEFIQEYLQNVPELSEGLLYAQSLEREGRDENASVQSVSRPKSMRSLTFAF